ncbi:MAG: hypothetical protein ACLFTK_12875 [Anaerolineales bacterium]
MSKRGKKRRPELDLDELLDDPEDWLEDRFEGLSRTATGLLLLAGSITILLFVGIALTAGVGFVLFEIVSPRLDTAPHQHRLRVVGHHWTHEIIIETYTQDGEWVYADSTIAQGDARDDELGWRDPGITPCPEDALEPGCQRIHDQVATYRVRLQAPSGEQLVCVVPRETWQQTPLQAVFRAEVGRECATLEPEHA